MPRKSTANHAADFAFVIDKVLDLEGNPEHPIRLALDRAGIVRVLDLLDMDIDRYYKLTYRRKKEDGSVEVVDLEDHNVGALVSFKRFNIYLANSGMATTDWQSIDPYDYEMFVIGPYNCSNPPTDINSTSLCSNNKCLCQQTTQKPVADNHQLAWQRGFNLARYQTDHLLP